MPSRSNISRSSSATRQHSTIVAGGPGSRSNATIVGWSYAVAVPSEVCSSSAARFASQMSVGRSFGETEVDFARAAALASPAAGPAREDARDADPVGPVVGAVLLVEELVVDAVRVADPRQRPVTQVAEHGRRDARVVVDHVPLGEARRGIHDLVEVGELELAALDVYFHARSIPCPAREGQCPQGDGRRRAAGGARAGGRGAAQAARDRGGGRARRGRGGAPARLRVRGGGRDDRVRRRGVGRRRRGEGRRAERRGDRPPQARRRLHRLPRPAHVAGDRPGARLRRRQGVRDGVDPADHARAVDGRPLVAGDRRRLPRGADRRGDA